MASFLIYVSPDCVEEVSAWLKKPYSFTPKFNKHDIIFTTEGRLKNYISIMVSLNEWTYISDFIESEAESYKEGTIDREKILTIYLERLGENPRNLFSPSVQSAGDMLKIIADIIEEQYSINSK